MAQPPFDLRIVVHPEAGSMMIINGQVINTTNLGNDAIIWNAVRVLTASLPSGNVLMEELHRTAVEMTTQLQNGGANANPEPKRELADLVLPRQMEGCAPPTDDDSECSLCLESHTGQQWVMLRTCEHTFHRCCIEAWANPTCPLCNGDLLRNTRRRKE